MKDPHANIWRPPAETAEGGANWGGGGGIIWWCSVRTDNREENSCSADKRGTQQLALLLAPPTHTIDRSHAAI